MSRPIAASIDEEERFMPGRIQLRRSRGWRLPEGARSVARPGPFGNPFPADRPGDPESKAEAVERFRDWVRRAEQAELRDRARRELKGRDLACWCAPGLPCHAEVWLVVANEDGP